MTFMVLARSVDSHSSHSERNRTSQKSPKGITCIVAMPSTFRQRNSSSNFWAVSSLVTPKSRLENSSVGTLNDIVSVITMPLITLMTKVLAMLWSMFYCRIWVQLVNRSKSWNISATPL